MQKLLYSSFLIAILFFSATLNGLSDSGEVKKDALNDHLKALVTSDPKSDFEQARSKGDIRFLAMMSYAMVVPGVPEYREKYSRRVGVKLIRGTSDAITNEEQRRLFDAVQRYEEKYNQLVVDYLAKHKDAR